MLAVEEGRSVGFDRDWESVSDGLPEAKQQEVSVSGFIVHAFDRRSVRRSTPWECQVVRERDFKLVGRRLLDLSTAGVQVAADAPVLTGEGVIVSFKLPESSKWIDAEAIVTRVVHGRRPSDRGRSLGLRFESLDAPVRALLGDRLRRMAPTLPMRAPRVDYAATVRRIAQG